MGVTKAEISPRTESRLFPILLSIGLLLLIQAMPVRFQVLPPLVARSIILVLTAAMLVANLTGPTSVWAKVERWVIIAVAVVATVLEFTILRALLSDIISHHRGISPLTMLASSIAVWTMNILVFSLVYWQLDRGGPSGRALGFRGRADFTFPQGNPGDGVPDDWRPGFADYFALGFNTSTAFSPTDTAPLTPRAKMLLVAQSTISLVTIVVVAARAINILT